VKKIRTCSHGCLAQPILQYVLINIFGPLAGGGVVNLVLTLTIEILLKISGDVVSVR
jgi:hypothetical protein